jgi:hypothetical protein
MGWWTINNKGGGIAGPAGRRGVGGDEPADLLSQAIRKCIGVWFKEWQRPPTRYEMEAAFRFAMGSFDMQVAEKKKRPRSKRLAPQKKTAR